MKNLIGKTVKEIKLGENERTQRDSITFCTNEGDLTYDAYGDCCSNSYIHEIDGRNALIGYEVLDVIAHESKEFWDKDHCDLMQVYNYDIITKVGTCTLDFRNESNGYYGGWLELRPTD